MDFVNCPNCNETFSNTKDALSHLMTPILISQSEIDFINKFTNEPKDGYCTKCSHFVLEKIAVDLKNQKEDVVNRLKDIVHNIPILTSPAPTKWDYEVIGMVSARSMSNYDFSNSFGEIIDIDLSNKINNNATNLCKSDLIIQCVKNGGNAIISTFLNYNELGTGHSKKLMINMTGTAIIVKDLTGFNLVQRDEITKVLELTKKLELILEKINQLKNH